MSGKKSALTAALAGGTPIPTVPQPTNKSSSLGNLAAFPCLWPEGQEGEVPPSAAAPPAEQFEDPYSTPAVGSLPTRTSLPGGKQLVRRIGQGGGFLVTWRCDLA